MLEWIRRMTGVTAAPTGAALAALHPAQPFWAVGDIHGCDDLLVQLLGQIAPDPSEPLIFLGDYVDRGPASAAVLGRLFDLAQARPADVICLQGNHERMLCHFIDDPLGRGSRWLRYGGRATLQSYGISPPAEDDGDQVLAASDALAAAMPANLMAWVRGLPKLWQSGNICCVHAAMDPARGADRQSSDTLLWGHPEFLREMRADNLVVLHGHTVVRAPTLADGRIAIDTGAYQTGRLTAARIAPQFCRFVTT